MPRGSSFIQTRALRPAIFSQGKRCCRNLVLVEAIFEASIRQTALKVVFTEFLSLGL